MVRINNHEHTDVSEYVGSFAPDEKGGVAFHDGALAQAGPLAEIYAEMSRPAMIGRRV